MYAKYKTAYLMFQLIIGQNLGTLSAVTTTYKERSNLELYT
jgi:hypothetical protein